LLVAFAISVSALAALGPSVSSAPSDAIAAHRRAQRHLFAGQIEKAVATWETAIAQAPEDFEILAALGAVLLADGRAAQAVPYLRRAAAREPADWALRNILTTAMLLAGDQEGAAAEIREIRDKSDNWLMRELGSVKLAGKYDLVLRDPTTIEPELARRYKESRQLGSLWVGQLTRFPENVGDLSNENSARTITAAYDVFALLEPGMKGSTARGGDFYDRYAVGMLVRTTIYARNRYLVTARLWRDGKISSLEALQSVFGRLHFFRNNLSLLRGKQEAAFKEYLEQLWLGMTQTKSGMFHQGAASFRKVLKVMPNNPPVLTELASVEVMMGLLAKNRGEEAESAQHFRAARENLEQALRIWPDYADSHVNLGATHSALGDLDSALASARRAVELEPTSAAAYFNAAEALHEMRRDRERDAVLEQLGELAPYRIAESRKRIEATPRRR
jgi:Tfp pilus assembly protein PilF